MKNKTHLWLAMLSVFAFVLTLSAFGQTNDPGTNSPPVVVLAPPAMQLQNLLLLIIPILVPLLIAVGKWAIPSIPSWALPIVAPALGALADWLLALAAGTAVNPLVGALLGSAGVGVRELVDQTKSRLSVAKLPTSILLVCGMRGQLHRLALAA